MEQKTNIIQKKREETMDDCGSYEILGKFIKKLKYFDNEQEEREYLERVIEELELRIGEEISSHFSTQELIEFDSLLDPIDKMEWIQNHVPQYKEIVRKHRGMMSIAILVDLDLLEGYSDS